MIYWKTSKKYHAGGSKVQKIQKKKHLSVNFVPKLQILNSKNNNFKFCWKMSCFFISIKSCSIFFPDNIKLCLRYKCQKKLHPFSLFWQNEEISQYFLTFFIKKINRKTFSWILQKKNIIIKTTFEISEIYFLGNHLFTFCGNPFKIAISW